MTVRLESIIGKIIALTKEVFLIKPTDGSYRSAQFMTGGNKRLSTFSGFGLTWWYGNTVFTLCEDISEMAMSYDAVLRNGDRKAFSETIMDVLQENALNRELFDGDRIVFMQAKTLFDARKVDNVEEFGKRLWGVIHQALLNTITTWAIIYPLHRINSPSYSLRFDGISLLRSVDYTFWGKLAQKYPGAKNWDPFSGKDKSGSKFEFVSNPPSTWLVCELIGTEHGARITGGRLMRKFIAVLLSYMSLEVRNLHMKSMAKTFSVSIQFPEDAAKLGIESIVTSLGVLLPPLIADVTVSEPILSKVSHWYEKSSSVPDEIVNRAGIGSHFIHYAIVNDDIEQFIHYFIALDAFFGQRDKVEESIVNGIKKLFPDDSKWISRAKNLFKLRSELIHGGTSSIEEWKGLDHYRRFFHSDPLKDVRIAAMAALREYFHL